MTTMVLTGEQLTGAYVRQLREYYHLSRRELAELAGFPTPTRIVNIEAKDSWKAGNRDALAEAFNRLAISPPKTPIGRRKGETAEQRIDRLQAALHANGHAIDEPAPDAAEEPPAAFYDASDELDAGFVPAADDEPAPAGFGYSPDADVQVDMPATQEDPFPLDWDRQQLPVLTNSEVATWQRCRRKWWLTWFRQLALAKQDYTGPRAIGNRVHRALAAWYAPEGEERVDPRDALERAIVEDWTAIAAQSRERAVGDIDEALGALSTHYNDAVSLERAMVEGYVQWLEETGVDSNLVITAPETVLSADLDGVVAGDTVQTRILAKLDVRVTRANDGTRLLVDHKTVGNFASPVKTLHLDPQMLEYHLLEWLNTPEGEARCDGALYNMLRKVKRTSSAKPPFYDRVEVHHNMHELDAYRRRLLGVARDIQRATRELEDGGDPMSVVYPNPRGDCSWDCDFFPVCPMFDDGSRVEDALSALYVVVDPNARYSAEETGI